MAEKSKILEKIEKLLALQTSPNEHEAARAAEKVRELLIKYNLDLAEIRQNADDVKITETRVDFIYRRPHQHWEVFLAMIIGRSMFCEVLSSRIGVYFVGRRADADVAAYTYNNLRKQLYDLAVIRTHEYVEEMKSTRGISPRYLTGSMNFKVWRNNWLLGAVHGIGQKLNDQKKADSAQIQALVLVRGDEVSTYLHQTYPSISTTEVDQTGYGNHKAYSRGEADGYSLNIQKPLH